MRIQIRTLNHSNFQIDVEATCTIDKIKEMIEEKTNQSKASQVLIFAGKLLSNDDTLESANIKDKDFLVLVAKKAKTSANTPSTQISTPVTSPQPITTTIPDTPPTKPESDNTTTSNNVTETGLINESSQTLVTGPLFQSVVDEISSSMGFPKEQVVIALRASYGHPDRAVDYLLSGSLPADFTQPQSPPPATTQTQQPPSLQNERIPSSTPTSTNGPTSSSIPTTQPRVLMTGGVVLPENIIPPALASQVSNLQLPTTPPPLEEEEIDEDDDIPGDSAEFLSVIRDNPMFASLQELAIEDPQRFQELVTQLIQSNPHIGQLAGQDIAQLVAGRPQAIQLQITPQDQEALERLISLGFTRNRAIEAYFLFEKSEDAAANYLLNTKDDEDEMEFLEGDMEDDDPEDEN